MTGPSRAGAPRWPHGASCAVAITVNADADRALLAGDPGLHGRTKTLSTARYGMAHGVDRLLTLFADCSVATSWFAPGRVAAEWGATLARVAAAGHTVGIRGWDLERFDTLGQAEQAAAVARAVRALRAQDIRADGFRLPSGDWPFGLVEVLAREGISWSSSWVADDEPFWLRGPGGLGLVELPYHHVADDRQAFAWNFDPAIPAGHSRIASYDDVLGNWLLEFEGCHEEGLLWVLTLHPEICGTPGRLPLVRELLTTLTRHPDVWIATGAEIARWWAGTRTDNDPRHPSEVFLAETGRRHY